MSLGATRRVLVVDDEKEYLLILKNTLELRGFEVVIAENAVSAGMEIAARVPDLILMDINMPGINGLQACEAMKRNAFTKDVPIIVVSALSDEGHVKSARKIGVTDYLVKPINIENLLQRIKEILHI